MSHLPYSGQDKNFPKIIKELFWTILILMPAIKYNFRKT